MEHRIESRLQRTRRQGVRGLVALVAGLAVTAAWSSQIAGGNIGKTVTHESPTKSAPNSTKPSTAAASSSAKRAASGSTR